MRATILEKPIRHAKRLHAAPIPHFAMQLFTLMAIGDGRGERRPLSIREASDRLGITLGVARSCFRHPRAWQILLRLVDRPRQPGSSSH
jgi:hypothetical protein